jgi:hypothetical protein
LRTVVQQPFAGHGFDQEIVSTQPHGIDCAGKGAVGRDDDEGRERLIVGRIATH